MDDPEFGSGTKGDKQPMYQAAPEDNAPVAQRTFLCTVGLLCVVAFGLLVTVIMCLNGTIPAVNNANYVRPATVENMDNFDVVKHMSQHCRPDLAMRINTIKLSPDPLILPDRAFDTEFDIELLADMPHDVHLELTVQRLDPPWNRVPCVNGQGSCDYYEDACENIGKMFGKKDCKELTKGHHKGTVPGRMVDMMGPLGFIQAGNYFVHARINQRDETYGCMIMSFRVASKAP